MFVMLNTCTYGRVVVIPFMSGYGAVLVFVPEVLEELGEDLVLSHVPTLNLRVH